VHAINLWLLFRTTAEAAGIHQAAAEDGGL